MLEKSKKKLILFGAGGHAKVLIDAAIKSCREVAYLLDSNAGKENQRLLNFEIKRYFENMDISAFEFVVAIGNDKVRQQWYDKLSRHLPPGIIIHPSAAVTNFCDIGSGTVVLGNVNINPDTYIGKNVIINTGAIVEHDCYIGHHCHIAPHATMCGGVIIGECTLIGASATVLPGKKIGNNVIVGAGSVVTKNIPDNVIVTGNPAKIFKTLC